jgi:hypothetical protein
MSETTSSPISLGDAYSPSGQPQSLNAVAPPSEPSSEPAPEPTSEPAPEPSPKQSPKQSLEPSPGPLPGPPGPLEQSQPAQSALTVYNDLDQAGSLGSNPSHGSVSGRSHRSLGSNVHTRKDKGKGKETETADIYELKGSSGEISNPPTNVVAQQMTATTVATASPKKKRRRHETNKKQPTNAPQCAGSSLPQSQELNQTNDSQESQHQGMMIRIVGASDADDLCQFNRSLYPITAVLL